MAVVARSATMFTIEKTFSFDAAHFLSRVPVGHKCRRMHGHTYAVTVRVRREALDDAGMVLDYGELSKAAKPLVESLDHRVLNEIEGLENPTAEVISRWIYDRLHGVLPEIDSVVVKETAATASEYRRNGRRRRNAVCPGCGATDAYESPFNGKMSCRLCPGKPIEYVRIAADAIKAMYASVVAQSGSSPDSIDELLAVAHALGVKLSHREARSDKILVAAADKGFEVASNGAQIEEIAKVYVDAFKQSGRIKRPNGRRRNSDESLRAAERAFAATGSADDAVKLAKELLRSGLDREDATVFLRGRGVELMKAHETVADATGAPLVEWKLINYGVSGTAEDGWDINDLHYTGDTIILPPDATYSEVHEALLDQGTIRGDLEVDSESSSETNVVFRRPADQRPAGSLERSTRKNPRRRNAKVGDLFQRPPGDEPWRYPFDQVKNAPGEGYYIDATDDPVLLARAQTGDKVADFVVSRRPYWEVKFVDEAAKRIWVDPIGDNPYVTGVGAGGAVLSDHDWKALSGEAGKESIDLALERVSARCVTEYGQLVPLLKGWVPPFFGPNGRQGGHYGSDWSYTVGARERLSPEEIVIADARAIGRFGIDVPPAALKGEVKPTTWQKFIRGDDDLSDVAGTELRGEDWSSADACVALVLKHPMEPIKRRNWVALVALVDKDPREIVKRETAPARWSDPDWVENYGRVREDVYERSRQGEYRDERLERRAHNLALGLTDLSHPRCQAEDDVYVRVRLAALSTARHLGWLDVIRAYETDPSFGVRHEVSSAWHARRNEEALRRMEAVEAHPDVLSTILVDLWWLGVDPLDFVDADPARYAQALLPISEDSWLGTYARSLNESIKGWRSKKRLWSDDWRDELERNRKEATKENPPLQDRDDHRYRYVGNCVHAAAEDIHAMTEAAREITRPYFVRKLAPGEWAEIQKALGYSPSFPIAKDWAVNYYRSMFRGQPAVFLEWSAIEYVFTLDGKVGPPDERRDETDMRPRGGERGRRPM